MKRCPECRKDYLDDSLLYCLDDGSALIQGSVTDEPETAILSTDAVSGSGQTRRFPERNQKSTERRLVLSRARLPWLIAAVLGLICVCLIGEYISQRHGNVDGGAVQRLAFAPPPDLSFNDVSSDWAVISPDGQKVAFNATSADGKNRLYVRNLDSMEAKLIPGSDYPIEPFWSPDSKWIAYGSNGKLKRSDLTGANPQVICDAARLVGGSWSKDGIIIFVPDYRTTLIQVSAQGGAPMPAMTRQVDVAEERHRYPYFLPDGRHFLFVIENKGIWAGALDSPDIKLIVSDPSPFVYDSNRYLVYIHNDALVAQPFDARSLSLGGEPVPIITGQRNDGGNHRFSVSDNGILLWQGQWQRDYQLKWFDRTGKELGGVDAPAKVFVGEDPHISPDGKQVVVKKEQNLWITDLDKGTGQRITSTFAQIPAWSPDGKQLVYSAAAGMTVKNANGSGESEMISSGAKFSADWSPDGRFILFRHRGVKTRFDMYAMPTFGDKKEYILLDSPFDEQYMQLSPDGKWLAYSNDEAGDYEVYVVPFTFDGRLGTDRKRVSTSGGRLPVWRRDGKELFFASSDGTLMSAEIKSATNDFQFATPKPLFKPRILMWYGNVHEYDVSPDGQRFLIGTLLGDSKAPPPTIITNWTSLLKK